MKRTLENLKSFILTILILSSLILTGGLWFDNYQGLSLLVSSFHNDMLAKLGSEKEISIVHDKIIMPYKVTIINPEKNKWIFYESDSVHKNAWDIMKNRLNSVTEGTEIITGKVKEWDSLFTRKSMVFEFGGPVEFDILRLVIPQLPKESTAFDNVEKIGITKSLDGNTVYILQNDGIKKSLYKVLLKGEDEEIDTFMENCENIKANVKYVELEKVGTTKFFGNKEVTPQNSVLFPVANAKNHRNIVKQLEVSNHFDVYDEYATNRFVVDIFNNTDFAKFVTNDESNIFINDDKSSIKFEKNGVVEYVNNSKLSGEITSASKNFNAAMNFINNMRVYENIYLLSATEADGIYTFSFSIAENGILAGFKEPVINDDTYSIIEIKVAESQVRYFKGKLIDIEVIGNGNYISVFTHNILDNILSDVEKNTKINISEIEMIYSVDEAGTYYPNWLVKYSDKKADIEKTALIYTMKK